MERKELRSMKIRGGEAVLMSAALNTGGFVSLTLDQSDKFHLVYDRDGKKVNLPMRYLDKMLTLRKELRGGAYICGNNKLPFFEDKREIAWLRKYFKANSPIEWPDNGED